MKNTSFNQKWFNGFFVVALFVSAMAGSFYAFAQEMNEKKNESPEKKEMNSRERAQWFQRLTTSGKDCDDGNRIIAIRRIEIINIVQDENDSPVKNKKTVIELELFSKVKIPVTSFDSYVVTIGKKNFPIVGINSNQDIVFVEMTYDEFNDLEDGAIVSLAAFPGVSSEVLVKESEKNKGVQIIVGAKFGKINKKMIDRFPTIQENEENRYKRLGSAINQPE